MHTALGDKESGVFHFLQPELLNETALKQILELKCVKLPNMHAMSKAQLVEIFYRVAVPLPQRKYKDNRRGRLLTKMRRKQERSRQKTETAEKKSSITYGFSEASTSRGHGTADRLKPPPDTINFERKKIKLSSSSLRCDDLEGIQIKRLKKFEKPNTNGDILDRIIIKDRRKEKEEKTKSEAQSIKHEPTDDGSTNTAPEQSKSQGFELHSREKESGSRRIKLKRSYSSSISEKTPSTSSSSKDSEGRKRKTKIIWP